MPWTTRRVDLSTRMLIIIVRFEQECSLYNHELRKFKLLAILRHFNRPAESLANVIGHSGCRARFAVRQERAARRGLEAFQPVQNFFPVSMGGKAADTRQATTHRYPVAQHFDFAFTILDATAQGPCRLITHKHNSGITVRQDPQRVMQDSTAGHHTGSAYDDTRALRIVQALRLLA